MGIIEPSAVVSRDSFMRLGKPTVDSSGQSTGFCVSASFLTAFFCHFAEEKCYSGREYSDPAASVRIHHYPHI